MRHILIASVVATCCFAANSSQGAIIRLKATAAPTTTIIRLGDIADVYDANANLAAKLRQIAIAPAPQAGASVRLTFDHVRSRLRAHGISMSTTEIGGSGSVTVSPARTTTTPNRATTRRQVGYRVSQPVNKWDHRRAEQYVSQSIAKQVQQIAPQLGPIQVDVTIDQQDARTLLNGNVAGYDLRSIRPTVTDGYQTTAVGVFDRNEQRQTINVNYRIQSQPTVLAVNRVVGRGEIIQASDLVEIPADKLRTGISQANLIIGKEAKRSLRVNEAVSPEAIRAVRLINVGDVVTVTTRLGGIVVQRQMKAISSGALGEAVTLSSLPRGKERVFAQVTALREAEVGKARTPQLQQNSNQLQQTANQVQPTSNTVVRPAAAPFNLIQTRVPTSGARQ